MVELNKKMPSRVELMVLMELMVLVVLVELMASLLKLMVFKWHEQEISLPGPHSRST